MKHPKLVVEERKITGKLVKKLRREGILPGNVYGKDIKSTAVQVSEKDFIKTYKEVGETGLVDLEIKDKTMPVLIHNVHKNYRNDILHTDFYKVNLKEKIKAMVPVEVIGEPKAVTEKLGILMQLLSEVEVEALPEELPEKIELNVESLAEVGQHLTVEDLKVTGGAQITTDASQIVVKIDELVSKEAQELAAEEAAAAEEAKAEAGEATEGEESEKKEDEVKETEEQKPEEKTEAPTEN